VPAALRTVPNVPKLSGGFRAMVYIGGGSGTPTVSQPHSRTAPDLCRGLNHGRENETRARRAANTITAADPTA
jgi:hypothetical protein